MAVSPGLGITVPAGVSLYRITSRTFRTAGARHHQAHTRQRRPNKNEAETEHA
jgi:hypothetical protein